jgi:hypothetical protein
MDSIEARIDYLEERERSVTAEVESLLDGRGNQPKPRVASASVPQCPPNAHELDHLSLLKWQALSGAPVLPFRSPPASIPLLVLVAFIAGTKLGLTVPSSERPPPGHSAKCELCMALHVR